MKTALIVTTYNAIKPLELCLRSVLNQYRMPDEIIVADDGSKDDTKNLVDRFIKDNSQIKILHSWQEDKGFRLSASRNRAIAKTDCEYIIIVDGDMIVDTYFVYDHIHSAKKNCYLQGSRVLLSSEFTQKIYTEMKFCKPYFFSKKMKNSLHSLRFHFLSKCISYKESQDLKGVRGCNFSFFRNDFLKVNGFNEDFTTWGREDSEFIARLFHIGVKRKNIKFAAVQYHLYHQEGSASSFNDTILQKTIDEKLVWCKNGVDKYL